MDRTSGVDLTHAAVFLDFDGTITTADVGQHLLTRLAGPEWLQFHDEYDAGEIGSRECLSSQWDLVHADQETARAVAREVEVDPGFVPLVDALRRAGAEVLVVSDGFGFYTEEVCGPLDIPVLTNAIDWDTRQVTFPNEDRCCPCSTCGTCKQAPVKDARYRGLTTVMVGDGTSDRKAALLSDVVFAKGPFREWCAINQVPHVPFETLSEVHAILVPE